MNENNVRTLDFSGDGPQVMPEDIYEGDAIDYADAEPQFTEGTLVTADFSAPEPLTSVGLHRSEPFVMIEIPSLGIELPLDIPTATSLFDELGAAINAV